MIDFSAYDFTDPDDVLRLGGELGAQFNGALVPVVQALPTDELRVVFFTAFLACPFGGMRAAVGSEASTAIVETLLRLSNEAHDQGLRRAH